MSFLERFHHIKRVDWTQINGHSENLQQPLIFVAYGTDQLLGCVPCPTPLRCMGEEGSMKVVPIDCTSQISWITWLQWWLWVTNDMHHPIIASSHHRFLAWALLLTCDVYHYLTEASSGVGASRSHGGIYVCHVTKGKSTWHDVHGIDIIIYIGFLYISYLLGSSLIS